MEIRPVRLAASLAALFVIASAVGAIKWAPNFPAALNQAKAAKKLVMVEFYTSWDVNGKDKSGTPLLNWCGKLEKETFADPSAQKVIAKFIAVRVNVEKEGKDLGTKFHVTNYPTVLFLDGSENACGTIDGFESADEFVKHGNSFLKDYADFPGAEAKYKVNPKDLNAVSRLAAIYGDRYEIDKALAKLSEAEKLDPNNTSEKLSDAYSNIGDYYQNASKFDAAIPYFKKEAVTSKITDKRAYGYLSIVACYFSKDAPTDPGEAPSAGEIKSIRDDFKILKDYVTTTLALPNLKKEDRQIATQDLTEIDNFLGGTGG